MAADDDDDDDDEDEEEDDDESSSSSSTSLEAAEEAPVWGLEAVEADADDTADDMAVVARLGAALATSPSSLSSLSSSKLSSSKLSLSLLLSDDALDPSSSSW